MLTRKKSPGEITRPDVPKVFVSSTYLDNRDRRKLVEDAITMAGMLWHGMELFTASKNPTVEECLRHVQEADLLVGIIARRYGWEPDGVQSITEMEYDAAKERLMFLLDPELPTVDQDFDTGPERWDKQKKLDAFKQRIAEDQMPTLFMETTLQAKVLKALNDWRADRDSKGDGRLSDAVPVPMDDDLEAEIQLYREKADSLHASLPVAGFVQQLKVAIDIEDIYVSLRAMVDLRGVADETFADADQAEKSLRESDAALDIALTEAFRQSALRNKRGVVILGDPGSGKTTHLKRLLLWCLRNGPERIGLPSDMLPVFLALRELKKLDQGIDAFIQDQLHGPHLQTPAGFGERLLRRGRLLFLLDGLDEVANLAQREQVAKWIVDGLRVHPTCRFVVTSRFAGYSPTVHLSGDFLEMHIRPLTAEQAERFVHRWYALVEKGLAKDPSQAEGIAQEKAENLVQRLREPDFRARRVFELTRNPLLLANICLVHRHRGGLPHKRARLYEECIDVLLEHWRQAKNLSVGVSAQAGRRALQPAALWLHREEGRTRATAAELAPQVESVLKAAQGAGGTAADFLHTIRDESGLLTGWDTEHYGFMHLGFQEYLAAREIHTRAFETPAVLSELAAHFGDSWWQEVAFLLLGLEDLSLFTPYMREVVKQPSFATLPELVEACLDDAVETSVDAFVELLRVPAGEDRDLWARQFQALRVLHRLDPEIIDLLASELVHHPSSEIQQWMAEQTAQLVQDVIIADPGGYELVKIPGGVFRMGSPTTEAGLGGNEGPRHPVQVPDFYLGRYPVTNEAYAQFLAANPDVREPEYWADRQFNQPRQPVVGVSWEDARHYAAWAGLRLPSEAEWEYACRAGSDTRYATGDTEGDLARTGWYDRNADGKLHAVGEKSPNAWGLYDMHGNVWEWVEDDWHDGYEAAPNDGLAWIDDPRGLVRVFRGGGWSGDTEGCRSSYRGWDSPSLRADDVGFRLARAV